MKNIIFYLFLLVLGGCASTQGNLVELGSYEPGTESTLYIYRTNTFFHGGNPEEPFFYVDEKEIGHLGTGEWQVVKLPSGQHTLSVKEPVLFMPSYESERITITTEPGETYYLRYSKDFAGASAIGSVITVSGKTAFSVSDKKSFDQKN